MKNKHLIFLLFPILITLGVFFQTAYFDSIGYDDPAYLYENTKISSGFTLDGIKWALTETGKTNLWHPITWYSLMLDVELFGLESTGAHHLMNVAFHLGAVIALYFLIVHYTENPWLAVIICCLWAIHPHRAHNIAWISQRKDVLSMCFLLFAWLTWVKSKRTIRSPLVILALLLFALSLMSKASGLGLPIILFVSDYLFHRKNIKASLPSLALFSILSIATAVITIYFQNLGNLGELNSTSSPLIRAAQLPYTFWWYAQSTLYSNGALWVYSPVDTIRLYVIPSIALLILFAALTPFRKNKFVLLGIVIAVAFWLPVSGITSVSFYKVAERYSYFIQLGYLFILIGIISTFTKTFKSKSLPPVLLGLAAILCILVVATTFQRTKQWRDSHTLFTHEASINPKSLLAHIFLGIEAKNKDDFTDAIVIFKQALNIDPESGLASLHMGDCYKNLQQLKSAKLAYKKATKAKNLQSSTAFQQLAILLMHEQQFSDVESTLHEGLLRFPNDIILNLDLGHFYFEHHKDYSRAIHYYDKVIKANPNFWEASLRKGLSLIHLGKKNEGQTIIESLKNSHPEKFSK